MTDQPQHHYHDFAETRDGQLVALNGETNRAVDDLARALMHDEDGEAALRTFKLASNLNDAYVHWVIGQAIELYAAWVIHHANWPMMFLWLQRLDGYIKYYRRIAA